MERALILSNHGIGDDGWLKKDAQFKKILAQFPADAYSLHTATSTPFSPGAPCGGYNYTVTIYSRGDEIERALAPLQLNPWHLDL